MQILILISAIAFLLISTLFLILYLDTKKKLLTEKDKNKNLEAKYNIIKESISKRQGYYYETTTLLSIEDRKKGLAGDPYKTYIYVQEIDRYTNGMSKIELKKIEVISGYSIEKYPWVIECETTQFSSLRKTSDIEWLESEDSIKELRKQKLKELDKLENGN